MITINQQTTVLAVVPTNGKVLAHLVVATRAGMRQRLHCWLVPLGSTATTCAPVLFALCVKMLTNWPQATSAIARLNLSFLSIPWMFKLSTTMKPKALTKRQAT